MLLLRVYPFPFTISAWLRSLLALEPHLIPLSLPETPSTYTRWVLFTAGRRNAPSLFPLWWWNGREKTRTGWEGERERRTEEEGVGWGGGGGWGSQSLTTLPWNNSIVPTPSSGEQAVVALSLHLTPRFSLSPSLSPALTKKKKYIYITHSHTHIMHTWTETVQTVINVSMVTVEMCWNSLYFQYPDPSVLRGELWMRGQSERKDSTCYTADSN